MRQKNNQGSHTPYPITHTRSAFTLIEILIVVAIIAILASVVLIGLGPTQRLGRDARRLSDLREVQTGLELYYGDCGYYPGLAKCAGGDSEQATSWTDMTTALTSSTLGIQQVPNDPSGGSATYYYTSSVNDSTYIIGATLEDASSSAFAGYVPPTGNIPAGIPNDNCDAPNYCLSL